jgi:hypothetical protein
MYLSKIEFAYQEPTGPPLPQQQQQQQQQAAGPMPNYMGYYPQGMSGVQQVPMSGAPQMYQQMPATAEAPVMSLPPLYVGPAMGMPGASGQVIGSEQAAFDNANAKKKHTSQWALEKRRCDATAAHIIIYY